MSDSFQAERPPSRVKISVLNKTGNATEKVELPFRMLVVGDFTGRDEETPVAGRAVQDLNKNNFEAVMDDMNVGLDLVVPDKLSADAGDEMKVQLKFDSMKAFSPEEVAKQVPALSRLVAMRMLLDSLKKRVTSAAEFRKELNKIVSDEAGLAQFREELSKIVKPGAE